MKTLHLFIFAVMWIVAFYFSIFIPKSVDGTETSNLEVTKNMACAGDIINFSATTYPNIDVEVALGWPNGIIENYTTATTSDQHGHFFSTIQMPYNAMSGIWKVFGKAGGDKFGFNVSVYSKKENYCTQTHETILESPLKQFKSRIAANDVKCQQDLQLVIKAEDGSPACVKADTAIILVGHRWATNVLQPNPMAGLNNDTGIATLKNQAYYFETTNYTDDAYHHPIQISFHDVIFNLFPSGFRGGLPAWGCGGSYYWADTKFSDGTSELLQIFVGDQQCFVPQPSTHFSIHKNPQAGLTFYDGKMKLLVSVDNQASQNPFMVDKDGKVDLSHIHLPPNNYGQIDYDKIGYLVSEDKFKKMLEQLDIKYTDNNFLLLTGESLLSYPPFTGYCGYVMDNNKEEHWFSSSFHRDTLTSYKISRYNPEPCKPGFASCFCNLQTKIAENNLKQLSYFSKSEEETVGEAMVQYLDKTKVVNVSNDFSVGKYNLQTEPSLVHYCGKFTWGEQLQYFEGYMKDSNVVFFELAPEQQKLCAINADAKIFSFEYKENGSGK